MNWGSIRGQEEAVASLRRDLDSGRVAHAYLFYGPQSVGKATTAGLFARALQCEGTPPPCGGCPHCLKIDKGVHPDVVSVRPAEGKKRIGVDSVRAQLLRRAYQRPQEGRWQIFLIDDAHRVTLGAYNALLKTLEEPPPATLILLVTPSLHALPATVVSRCRRVRFHALKPGDLIGILSEKIGGERPHLERLAALSMGRLGAAISGDHEGRARRREGALELLRGLSAPPGEADEVALLGEVPKTVVGGASSREEVLQFLEMIRGLLRDILVLQVAPGGLEPWNADLAGELGRIGEKWGVRGLLGAMEQVRGAAYDVGVVNTNPSLTLEALIVALRSTVAAAA